MEEEDAFIVEHILALEETNPFQNAFIDDQPTRDSNVYIVEDQSHLSAPESEPRRNINFFLNLPDIPFNVFAMTLSITELRALTQVSSSLKKRISEDILENQARKNDLKARIQRVMKEYPSNEDISNARWLSKFDSL